jgi:hypothetical protein
VEVGRGRDEKSFFRVTLCPAKKSFPVEKGENQFWATANSFWHNY